jgi:hypothetical protein
MYNPSLNSPYLSKSVYATEHVKPIYVRPVTFVWNVFNNSCMQRNGPQISNNISVSIQYGNWGLINLTNVYLRFMSIANSEVYGYRKPIWGTRPLLTIDSPWWPNRPREYLRNFCSYFDGLHLPPHSHADNHLFFLPTLSPPYVQERQRTSHFLKSEIHLSGFSLLCLRFKTYWVWCTYRFMYIYWLL